MDEDTKKGVRSWVVGVYVDAIEVSEERISSILMWVESAHKDVAHAKFACKLMQESLDSRENTQDIEGRYTARVYANVPPEVIYAR